MLLLALSVETMMHHALLDPSRDNATVIAVPTCSVNCLATLYCPRVKMIGCTRVEDVLRFSKIKMMLWKRTEGQTVMSAANV